MSTVRITPKIKEEIVPILTHLGIYLSEAINMLNIIFDTVPNYFTFDIHEIDFVIQYRNNIIAIEVKSNKSTNNISLTKYNERI